MKGLKKDGAYSGLEKGDKMADLIERQAVIDALHTWFKDGFDNDRWWNSTHVLAAIEGLPSVQPKIIRCKDCKHYYFASNRIPQEQRYACDLFGDRQEMFYCGYAERRKG